MEPKPRINKDDFDKVFIEYVRQMSKMHHLPKLVENQLLRQVSHRRKF